MKNISVKEWGGGKNLRTSGYTEITKPKKPDVTFGEMVMPITELVDKQSAVIQITMLTSEEQSYNEG